MNHHHIWFMVKLNLHKLNIPLMSLTSLSSQITLSNVYLNSSCVVFMLHWVPEFHENVLVNSFTAGYIYILYVRP